jgi:carbon-monoxide dehydrogenase large subunit
VMNAIIDALDGIQVEMPATPEKLWRAARSLAAPMAAE